MAHMPDTYRSSFWETDFLSQTGFDTIVTHIKEGQRSCKWLEDYLKLRAKAEDDYSKALVKISKACVGESGTLRKVVEEFKVEADIEAKLHATTSQKIMEEVTKLTEFREKQRDERKKTEEVAHKSHKNKADLYRKMSSCKNSYESRYKAAEKADSDAEKLKFGSKPKETEKARKTAMQCRASCLKADEDYRASVTAVEVARQQWVRDHSDTSDQLQKLEEDRIIFMRNAIWVYSNLVSELCVGVDDSKEKVRLVTEKCDESADIREFIHCKATSSTPLPVVEYIQCGMESEVQSTNLIANHNDVTLTSSPASSIYELGVDPGQIYTALYDYMPNSEDELELKEGDKIQVIAISSSDNGWIHGLNTRTHMSGLLPQNYVTKV